MTDYSKVKYHGNCHCGAVKFTLLSAPLNETSMSECNCSSCLKQGALWLLGVKKEDFTIVRGENTLREFVIDPERRNVKLFFCPTCGTSVMEQKLDGNPVPNVRTLSDIDIQSLKIVKYDMASKEPHYEPPAVPNALQDFAVEKGKTLYHGNCRCGLVIYSAKLKSFNETEVLECNCSSCSRNGDLWVYPKRQDVKVHGKEHLVSYAFLSQDSLHSFCGKCGVSVLVEVTVPDSDVVPLNVRTIRDINLVKLTFKQYDGRSNDPQYKLGREDLTNT